MSDVERRRPDDVMKRLTALCKRRGFVFQSSEIYGGLKSAYDYGPLGVELKRNLMNAWWSRMVHQREDVVGIDASIIMHPDVWRASGHAAGFADPLVDCLISKERFRADKAPRPAPGDELPLTCPDKGLAKQYAEQIAARWGFELHREGNVLHGLKAIDAGTVGFFPADEDRPTGTFPFPGYVSPCIGSPFLSEERQFNLMFRTALGALDPTREAAAVVAEVTAADDLATAIRQRFAASVKRRPDAPITRALAAVEAGTVPPDRARPHLIQAVMEQCAAPATAFLRPETAQAMFVQYKNVLDATGLKPPFGIAQMGKSFRNEITVEHFIFRSCEFEQMEMEFFCEPGTQAGWMTYWKDQRMDWWRSLANYPEDFRFRQHDADELAHYADDCYDVEFRYPWGWDELEGIASRTDHDLHAHEEHSGQRLRYTDPERPDPETGETPWTYQPYVIEPAAGATRGVLVYLLDAYHEEERTNAKGRPVTRTVLKLHPQLAPIKCAVLPLVQKDGMPEKARAVIERFLTAGIPAKYDGKKTIGKRYAKHDEIGTPCAITVDGESLTDDTVTLRDRDTTEQQRVPIEQAVAAVRERLARP